MPKGKKKRKQRREMPPLTLVDKFIYWLAAGVMVLVLVGLFWFWLRWRDRVEFGDPQVICVSGHLSVLWVGPALLSLAFTGMGLWSGWYWGRHPIFGIPGFLYGPPYPRIYPLFMKNRPERKPREKRFFRMTAAVLATVNLICLALSLLSVHGRDSLYRDGGVREVNMFGLVSEEYTVRDTEQAVLSVYTYSTGRGWLRSENWTVKLELQMTDGNFYEFSPGAFRMEDGAGEIRRWLTDLQELLELYPRVTVENASEIERVVDDHGLNETEAALLYRLFRAEG